MSKQEVIDYVMNSPHNTNRAVLSGMLDEVSSDSDKTGADSIFLINPISSDSPMEFDKTEEEIIEAINSNKNVKLTYSSGGGPENGNVIFLDLARITRTRPNHELVPTGELLTEYGADFSGIYKMGNITYLAYANMTFSPLDVSFSNIPLNDIE